MKYGKAIVSAFLAAGAGTLLGYDMGISGGTINYVSEHFKLDSSATGFALSVFIVGAIFGSCFTKRLNDNWGRRKALIFGALLMVIGALWVYLFGDNFSLFLWGRGIAGAGMGLLFSSEPSYVTEISPPNIRGALGSFLQLTTGIGIVVGYAVTYFMVRNATAQEQVGYIWKNVYGTEIIVAILFFISLFPIPESPVWYLLKGRDQQAKKVYEELMPGVDFQLLVEKYTQLHRNRDMEKNVEHRMEKLGELKKFLFIVFFMAALTELCGINPLIYYAPDIFRRIVKEGPNSAFYQSMINGVFFTLGSLVSVFTVDRFGRKTLLFIGTFTMSASLFIIGIYIYNGHYSSFLIFLIYLFIFAYNFSAGSIRFLYIGELSPAPLRAFSLGLAGIINWTSDFLVSWTLPIMINSIFLKNIFHGASVFFLYSIFGFIFFILVFTIPETKGKTLLEISKYWGLEKKK